MARVDSFSRRGRRAWRGPRGTGATSRLGGGRRLTELASCRYVMVVAVAVNVGTAVKSTTMSFVWAELGRPARSGRAIWKANMLHAKR